ncbi:MAG: hypothetical protein V1492_03745 [Candidatus Micrarchaeota archaeon]
MRFRNGLVPHFFRPCWGPIALENPGAFSSRAGLKEDVPPARYHASAGDRSVGGSSRKSSGTINPKTALGRFIFQQLVEGNDFAAIAKMLGVTAEKLTDTLRNDGSEKEKPR